MKMLVAVSAFLALSLVSGMSSATVFLPKICIDGDGPALTCPEDSRPPVMGEEAKQNLMDRVVGELSGRVVIDLRNRRFQVITPPQWHEFGADDVGYCVTDIVGYTDGWGEPPESKWFYYLRLNKEGCESEASKVNRAERYYPFHSYQDQRVVCDSSSPEDCFGAARVYSELWKKSIYGFADAENVEIFGVVRGSERYKSSASKLERLMLQRRTTEFRVEGFRDLSPESTCINAVSVGLICIRDGRVTIFPDAGFGVYQKGFPWEIFSDACRLAF